MRKVLITPATFKPLEVEAIKVRPELRVTETIDDLILADHLEGAIGAYQDYTNNILCLSTWDLYLDEFPEGDIETPGPLSSVESLKYYDSTGNLQTFSAANYIVDGTVPLMGRISLIPGNSWPSTDGRVNSVIVRLLAGYSSPNAIPQRIKDGLIMKIHELYDVVNCENAYFENWKANKRFSV